MSKVGYNLLDRQTDRQTDRDNSVRFGALNFINTKPFDDGDFCRRSNGFLH